MPWQRDTGRLDRVRGLMAERGLDAIVARAPDNIVYLTNFWGMKGYDAVVFPREGDPTLTASRPPPTTPPVPPGPTTCASSPATTRPIRVHRSPASSSRRSRQRPDTGRSGSSSPSARRRPTGWWASRPRSPGLVRRVPGRG